MKTVVHVSLSKPEVEAILRALVERRTGRKVEDCWEEVSVDKGVASLKNYHFQCEYPDGKETKETQEKEVKEKRPMHPLHLASVDGELQGAVQDEGRRD